MKKIHGKMEGEMNMERRMPRPGEFYRHFKDKLYQVLTVAEHSETGEKLVVYQALYGNYQIYARPLEMFLSDVDKVKYPESTQEQRFEPVQPEKTGESQSGRFDDSPGKSDPETSDLLDVLDGKGVYSDRRESEDFQMDFGFLEDDISIGNSALDESLDFLKQAGGGAETQESVDPRLLEFLDTPSYTDKLDLLLTMRRDVDDKLLEDMATVLDITLNTGSVEQKYKELENCLLTHIKYETKRFR